MRAKFLNLDLYTMYGGAVSIKGDLGIFDWPETIFKIKMTFEA